MKRLFVALAVFAASFLHAQTVTPVIPTISNGQVVVPVPDSSGGTHSVTFPVTAVTTLSVSAGTDTYTPPASVSSVQTACALTINASAQTQCAATVKGVGNYNSAVTWSSSAGSISSTGMFTAPATAGTVTVTATSVQDQSKVASATITVVIPPPVAPAIPANATAVDLIIPSAGSWKPCTHDAGTPGTATCGGVYPVTGITANSARSFAMSYTGAGGVRWANSFAKDSVSQNFVYDTQVISKDWPHVASLELDTNQVKANGQTAILGTQCSSYSKTWEVTLINAATGQWHWVPSNVSCNPLTWAPDVIHHVRIFGQIDASGVSTYIGVELDGTYHPFTGMTGATGEPLGWATGSVLENLQIDGLGASGAATVYADRLTIYRW